VAKGAFQSKPRILLKDTLTFPSEVSSKVGDPAAKSIGNVALIGISAGTGRGIPDCPGTSPAGARIVTRKTSVLPDSATS
jgi:hypothetical protein